MKHISISGFKEVIESEANNQTIDFVNVCTPAEYQEKHIKGVRSVPLDALHTEVDQFNQKKTIYIHCRSGKRGRQAVEKLQALGVTAELVNVEGGLMAWEEAGFETGSHTKRIPIIRQVFIGAGTLIIVGLLLTHLFNYNFLLIPLFVSIGLLVSGITGWCGAAIILSKMPWNNK